MGTSKRLAPHYDMQAQHQAILAASKRGPLQSLTDRELALRETPVTVYPHSAQRRVRAWVRLGPEPLYVDARVVRSTPLAAGIEFKASEQVFRCWVWGNAVSIDE
ncbi:hypothetical protein [uncultured Microbacterium sp.]|uniref:hypothetical protein n=1 Tax=uncultured Microbacterium sp. TaxID=191216 RepID=UPI0025DAB536|nr:hypothetical protein [uncultured Microbacterium sp.]